MSLKSIEIIDPPIITDGLLTKCMHLVPHLVSTANRIGVVGSYAKGTATKYSDLDLLVDIREDVPMQRRDEFLLGLADRLERTLCIDVDIVLLSSVLYYLNYKGDTFIDTEGYEEMLENVRWVYE